MSSEPVLRSGLETLVIMKKVEEKKKFLEQADADYSLLCDKVNKNVLELTALKMERFKVESLVQELDIRVKVYEMREKELKEQDERAKRSIKETKNRLAQELELRDSFDRKSSCKVVEMATEYCQFKNSCFKSKVSSDLQCLKTSYATLTSEVELMMQKLGLDFVEVEETEQNDEICMNSLQRLRLPVKNGEFEVSDICELQKSLQVELDLVRADNAKNAAHNNLLLKRKSSLLEQLNSLKKVWNK